MRYCELFEDMQGSITLLILDILTPLVSNGIPVISIDALIKKIKEVYRGQLVDRELIFAILDPNKIDMIEKIEGDNIYLAVSQPPERSVDDEQKKTDEEKVEDTAEDEAVDMFKQ